MARRAMPFFFLLSLALAGCDHATKLAAKSALASRGPLALLPGVLDLVYAENRDVAFSLLRAVALPHRAVLLAALAAFGAISVAILAWRSRHAPRLERLAYAMLFAGAIGNVLDRLARGYVVDFIHVAHWPVFNVADVLVVAGAIALVLAKRRAPHERRAPS